jgi:meso-butanediol dehydrogenase/(S,S)-butanediol dehydrogenase/diacetyl reductase
MKNNATQNAGMTGTSNDLVALVTGAGSGIGQAIAIILAENGYDLTLVGRKAKRLLDTASLLPERAEHIEVLTDVGYASQVSQMIAQTIAHFGRLDVLVNNAGFAPSLPIEQTSPEIIEEVYRVNALGPAYAIAKAWPIFARQYQSEKRGGCIINISTMGTIDPFPGFFAYAAAKASVNLMVKSCANEGKDIGVRAFAIAPGAVETQMLRATFSQSEISPAECLLPSDIARIVIECVSGRRDNQNGETILVSR